MLRWSLERGSVAWFRVGAVVRLPCLGHVVPDGRLRVALSHPYSHEARWYEDGQAGETDDTHRHLLRALHRARHDRHRLSLLRTGVFRSMDADVEYGDVLATGPAVTLLPAVSGGRTYARSRT